MTNKDKVWVFLLRPAQNSHMWKANQKLWMVYTTGAGRICVTGKYRGKGRWIKRAWVDSWPEEAVNYAKWVGVDREFAEAHGMLFYEEDPSVRYRQV